MSYKKISALLMSVLIIVSGLTVPVTAATIVSGEYSYEILNGTFCKITSYSGNETEIDMPEELDGYIVQSLGSALFSNNITLEKISLPYTLETVEGDIFNGCKSLKNITFTDAVSIMKKTLLNLPVIQQASGLFIQSLHLKWTVLCRSFAVNVQVLLPKK